MRSKNNVLRGATKHAAACEVGHFENKMTVAAKEENIVFTISKKKD